MENNTAIVIILGTAFTLLILALTAIIVITSQKKKSQLEVKMQLLELKRQREISENTLISQEKERQRVGLELHDELGPTFAAVRFNLARIQQNLRKKDIEVVDKLAIETSSDLEAAIGKFSDVSKMLYPVILVRHGLDQAISDLVEKANQEIQTNYSLKLESAKQLREIVQLTIYRVCQELLTNARKHAKAKQVTLTVMDQDNKTIIEYQDDGIGFDTTKIHHGLGLNSIKGRVEAIGGKVELISTVDTGVHYKIIVPHD